ncbi:MAG: tetratricopeptide repeat protein [Spirochaetales bacterium]|nr:tetratricopeptide repeat protein [Spirochaetales bacterium]
MKNKKCEQITRILRFVFILYLLIQGNVLFPEDSTTSYSGYYDYPFSFGVEYQSLFPLTTLIEDYNFNFFDVSGTMELPRILFPGLKPVLSGGVMFTLGKNLDTTSFYADDKYDHTSLYGGLGIEYSYWFSKLMEMGIQLTGGADFSSFPNLHPDEQARGSLFIYADCKVPLTINPIYNLSIDLQPGIRYRRSLSPLHYFDGFLFSIGGSINFRLGQDPDITGLIRSIRFNNVTLPAIFAGMQSYYNQNPAGSVSMTNIEKQALKDVKVSFYQAGFMDSPTPGQLITELKPGETAEIPFFAAFNGEIFNTEGITPLTGTIVVTYSIKGKSGEQTESVLYDLYDKTSLRWDDDKKAGAYITPADSVIKDYVSFIKQSGKEKILGTYNNPIQTAMLFYSGLHSTGCLYQADPILPFVSVQQDTAIIDTISLPRDTLKRITGDCDDLTVLYLSMLETTGIESGFITVPGHIYPVFNTGIPARNFRKVHPERTMTINLKGTVWVPVEVTMIGKGTFLQAWEAGAREWLAWEDRPANRKLHITREVQTTYRPVGLKKIDIDFPFGNSRNIAEGFEKNINALSGIIITDFENIAASTAGKSDYNKLGIIYAYFNKTLQAETAFKKAITADPDYVLAKINLGNLFYQTGRFDDALSHYTLALQDFNNRDNPSSATYLKLLLKLSVVCYELKQYDEARKYFVFARNISPGETELYSYLNSGEESKTRSSELPGYGLVLEYLEDE